MEFGFVGQADFNRMILCVERAGWIQHSDEQAMGS